MLFLVAMVFEIRSIGSIGSVGAKGTIDDLLCWKVAQISQDWIKMLPIIKYYVRRLNS